MRAVQSGNPFSLIKTVETSQELLDLAFSRAMKIKPPQGRGTTRMQRYVEHEKNRINTAANVITDRLYRMVNQFPPIDMIHPFYSELTDILIGTDKLKLALGRIHGVVDVIRTIATDVITKMNAATEPNELKQYLSMAFGRMSAVVYKLDEHLKLLEVARDTLAVLPGFDPLKPTVVVAGVPNVGKSSFVSSATSGKPEVAAYPFTTKRLVFGHRKFGFLQVQFCDTPGLLDRSIKERNDIELQAIAALKHISDVLLVIVDPSISATYPLEHQLELVEEFADFYPGAEVIVLVNKMDLFEDVERDEIIAKVKTFLKEYGMKEEQIEATPFISSFSRDDVESVILYLEALIKNKVIRNAKFRALVEPKIAEDQLPLEEMPEESFKRI